LLIRPGAIGDCILALPALEFLRADYTEVWISSPLVPLVLFADCVRSIASTGLDMVFDRVPPLLADKLESFDDVVSWYGSNRPEFRAALPKVRFFEALPTKGWSDYAADFFLQQVGGPTGIFPQIKVKKSEPRRSVVIHPFSGSARKNWPLEKYRALAGKLCLKVEWTAGPEEILECAHRFDDLLRLAEWMSGAALFLGNDSGISHLAAAIGVPSIVLFRATDPAVWGPRGDHVLTYKVRDL
jgi:hypothetical protein